MPTPRPSPDSPARGPYHLRGAAGAVRLPGVRGADERPGWHGQEPGVPAEAAPVGVRNPPVAGVDVAKDAESLTESALVTFEEKVLPEGHPALATGGQRRVRQAYRYGNGSTIVVGGLDKPGKVMSTEYDVVYVQEAIELQEEAWEAVTTRLRHGRLPYQQLMADTNPDRPTHWLKCRCDAGVTRLLESRHQDNPTLWDGKDWTPAGRTYISKLDALTGPRKQRLRFGRWVQAEGVVYDGWDAALHAIAPLDVPAAWTRYWSVDFGYTNPFVCQWWAKDPDGRLYLYREYYRAARSCGGRGEGHAGPVRRRAQAVGDRLRPRRGGPGDAGAAPRHGDGRGRQGRVARHPGRGRPAAQGRGRQAPAVRDAGRARRGGTPCWPRRRNRPV